MIAVAGAQDQLPLDGEYAGFNGEIVLLEELYKRGMALPEVGPEPARRRRHAVRVAHRADRAVADRGVARGDAPQPAAQRLRAHDPQPVRQRRELSSSTWRRGTLACSPSLTPSSERHADLGRGRRVDEARQHRARRRHLRQEDAVVRLVQHRVFTPAPADPIDFEDDCRAHAAGVAKALRLRKVWFDPFQMAARRSAWRRRIVPIEEYPQTVPNLTAATQNLFDLIQAAPCAVPRRCDAVGGLACDHRREFARLAPRQAQAAAQDRRGGRAVDGVPRRGARAGEARLRFVCARLVRRQC